MIVGKELKAGYCQNKSKKEEPWKTEKKNGNAATGDTIILYRRT
jgi:hypothetical protein